MQVFHSINQDIKCMAGQVDHYLLHLFRLDVLRSRTALWKNASSSCALISFATCSSARLMTAAFSSSFSEQLSSRSTNLRGIGGTCFTNAPSCHWQRSQPIAGSANQSPHQAR